MSTNVLYFFDTINMMQTNGDIENKRVGKKLKDRRIEKGLSIIELADRCQLSRMTIYRYESGKRSIRIEELARIAPILEVPISYFVEDQNDFIDTSNESMVISRVAREQIKQATKALNSAKEAIQQLTPTISPGEQKLLNIFRQLSPEEQKALHEEVQVKVQKAMHYAEQQSILIKNKETKQ